MIPKLSNGEETPDFLRLDMSQNSSHQGPSLVARQSKVPAEYYQPQGWSSSSQGRAHQSAGLNKFSPSEWSNSNVFHYNSSDQSRILWSRPTLNLDMP